MAAAARNYDCDTVAAGGQDLEGAAQNVHAAPLARQAVAIGAAARHRECEYAQALIAEMSAGPGRTGRRLAPDDRLSPPRPFPPLSCHPCGCR